MKPVSIPERLRHTNEGFETITIGPPPGTESRIGSVEAEVGESQYGPTILILMRLGKDDFTTLQENHGLFWFSLLSDRLYPFSMMPVTPGDTEGIDPNSMEAHLFVNEEEDTIATPNEIARAFHETYERLAPQFGYETREASAKPWDEVPQQNKDLMTAVVTDLFF